MDTDSDAFWLFLVQLGCFIFSVLALTVIPTNTTPTPTSAALMLHRLSPPIPLIITSQDLCAVLPLLIACCIKRAQLPVEFKLQKNFMWSISKCVFKWSNVKCEAKTSQMLFPLQQPCISATRINWPQFGPTSRARQQQKAGLDSCLQFFDTGYWTGYWTFFVVPNVQYYTILVYFLYVWELTNMRNYEKSWNNVAQVFNRLIVKLMWIINNLPAVWVGCIDQACPILQMQKVNCRARKQLLLLPGTYLWGVETCLEQVGDWGVSSRFLSDWQSELQTGSVITDWLCFKGFFFQVWWVWKPVAQG